MKPAEVEECYEVAMKLVKEAGEVVREAIKKQKNIETKSSRVDLVTESDKAVEKLLIEGFAKAFPGHKFIGEESTAAGEPCKLTSDPTWIIDPIDGTMNFVHSLPYTCVSVGLWSGQAGVMGIVYNPVLEQMFTAKRGQGAFLNGERIHASGCKDLSQALIFAEMGSSHDPEKIKTVLTNLTTLLPRVHGLRDMGSAALSLAYVGAGWVDAAYHLGKLGPWDMAAGAILVEEAGGVMSDVEGGIRALGSCALNMCQVACGAAEVTYEFGIHAWDTAAAAVVVEEAGGVVVDPAGGPFDLMKCRVLCAATPELAKELSGLLTQYYPTPDGDLSE